MKTILCFIAVFLSVQINAQFGIDLDLNRLKNITNLEQFTVMLLEKGWEKTVEASYKELPNLDEEMYSPHKFAYKSEDGVIAEAFYSDFDGVDHSTFSIRYFGNIDGSPNLEYLNLVKQIQSDCLYYRRWNQILYYACPKSKFPGIIGYGKLKYGQFYEISFGQKGINFTD